MTDPQQPYGYQAPQPYPPNYPAQPGYGQVAPYQGQPQPGYGLYPQPVHLQGYPQPAHALGGYGVDPATGLPVSDKSRVAAGLLELFLGGFGAGRFYLGHTGIGLAQLGLHLAGWFFFVLGFVTFGIGTLIALLCWMAGGLWALIDAIMMFSGSVKDAHGRVLRS